jgi:hypothetical protein
VTAPCKSSTADLISYREVYSEGAAIRIANELCFRGFVGEARGCLVGSDASDAAFTKALCSALGDAS